MVTLERSPKVLAFDEGLQFEVPGERILVKLASADTEGQFTFSHVSVDPQAGPPLHVHTHEDELFLIRSGQVQFTVGEETFVAKAGDTVFAPRGIKHRFMGYGDVPAEFEILITGSNFEAFYLRFAEEISKAEPDMARCGQIAAEHGIHFL